MTDRNICSFTSYLRFLLMSPKLISQCPSFSYGCFLCYLAVYIISTKFKSSKIWNKTQFFDSIIYSILLLNFLFFMCLILFIIFFVPRSSLPIEIGWEKERERGQGSPFLVTHLHMNTTEQAPFHTLSSAKIPTGRHYNTHPTGLSYPHASSHSENITKHYYSFWKVAFV